MPYNTAAIPPRKDVTGTAQLPLARVKKIISHDSDIAACSNNGAFVITLATEMFIQYFAEHGHNVVKSERKPRRNIQYRDLASAVSRTDTLEFLSDVVPRTVPYKVAKNRKARDAVTDPEQPTLLDMGKSLTSTDREKGASNDNGSNLLNGVSNGPEENEDEDVSAQLQMEIRGARKDMDGDVGMSANDGGRMVGLQGNLNGHERGRGPNGHGISEREDVEMN